MRVGEDRTVVGGIEVNTPYDNNKDNGVKVEDFLQLMVAQLQNQDFMNPVDDTQYVTQLAQFATMQSMQELSYYSQTNYVMSLVGKNVTAASLGLGGQVNKEVGIVSKVNLSGDEYTITVNGKEFLLNQIMSVNDPDGSITASDLEKATNSQVMVTQTTENSATIRWDPPVSDSDLQSGMSYSVYYTDNGQLDFTKPSTVRQGQLAIENTKDRTCTITGLEPGKTYFINVVVRNASGDEAVYKHAVTNTRG